MRFFSILVFIFFTSYLIADEVVLSDSTVVKGEIINNAKTYLEVKTLHLGILRIGKKDVEKIEITVDDEQLVDNLRNDVEYFNYNSIIWKFEKSVSGVNKVVTSEEDLSKWKYRFDFNWNKQSGNTDSSYSSYNIATKYEDGDMRINSSFYSERERNTVGVTRDNMKFTFDYEDKVDPHSWYTRSEVLRDTIRLLDLSLTQGLGYVHYFLKESEMELRLRTGAFITREEYANGERHNPAGIELGLYGFYIFENYWKIVSDIGYKANAADLNDSSIYHETYMEIPLSSDKLWNLRLGMRQEYDNWVIDGVEHLDSKVYMRLSIGWLSF